MGPKEFPGFIDPSKLAAAIRRSGPSGGNKEMEGVGLSQLKCSLTGRDAAHGSVHGMATADHDSGRTFIDALDDKINHIIGKVFAINAFETCVTVRNESL